MRPIRLFPWFLVLACGGGSSEDSGDNPLDIDGRWREEWSCEETCDGSTETITGTTDMTLSSDGTAVTRTDDEGPVWTGTLDGDELTLTTSSGDYTEESTFTFDASGDSFAISSTYSYATCTGTCTGTGTRL